MSDYRVTPQKTSSLPSGIGFIIGNEAAERFSFYGMRSVLLAYMTIYLVQPNGDFKVFNDAGQLDIILPWGPVIFLKKCTVSKYFN